MDVIWDSISPIPNIDKDSGEEKKDEIPIEPQQQGNQIDQQATGQQEQRCTRSQRLQDEPRDETQVKRIFKS